MFHIILHALPWQYCQSRSRVQSSIKKKTGCSSSSSIQLLPPSDITSILWRFDKHLRGHESCFFSVDADDTTKGGMKEATCFIYGCLPKRYSKKIMTDATFESCRYDFTFSFIAGPQLTMVVLHGTARQR